MIYIKKRCQLWNKNKIKYYKIVLLINNSNNIDRYKVLKMKKCKLNKLYNEYKIYNKR